MRAGGNTIFYAPQKRYLAISYNTMTMSRRSYLLITVIFFLGMTACQQASSKQVPVDLLGHGIPLKIMAPEDVEVSSSDLGIMKDVTIKNDNGYSIQIFESEATTLDVKKVLAKIKADITSSKFFSSISSDKDDGFIFEKKIDEDYITYDFRQVIINGDKQYVIQAGLSMQHTLEQVEQMYTSVQ